MMFARVKRVDGTVGKTIGSNMWSKLKGELDDLEAEIVVE